MNWIYLVILIYAVIGTLLWTGILKNARTGGDSKNGRGYIIAAMLVGLAVQVATAMSYRGHYSDMCCFEAWSDLIYKGGVASFYISNYFHDYTPGYVYVMWVIGWLKHSLALGGPMLWLVMKLPSIIANLAGGWIVYRIAGKRFSDAFASVFALLLLICPATVTDACLWGQVDSIVAFFCLLSLYWATERRFIPAFGAFALGLLFKPQALFFSPVLFFALVQELYEAFSWKKLLKYLAGAVGTVGGFLLLTVPLGVSESVGQYFDTIDQYPYMSVNAFNAYSAFGQNCARLSSTAGTVGTIMIVCIVLCSAVYFFKSKSPAKAYITAFIINFGIFMFSTRMHERYGYYGVFMLAAAYAAVPKGRNFLMFWLFSLSQFFNMVYIMFFHFNIVADNDSIIITASAINLALCFWFLYAIQETDMTASDETVSAPLNAKKSGKKRLLPEKKAADGKPQEPAGPLPEKDRLRRKDLWIILAIAAVYGAVALYALGDRHAPENGIELTADKEVVLDFGSEKYLKKAQFFIGERHLENGKNLKLTFLGENGDTTFVDDNTAGSVFVWTTRELDSTARYLALSTQAGAPGIPIREICITDPSGEVIRPVNTDDADVAALSDEPTADGSSYMCGTYFDEIYHARTAYEFIHGLPVYEWTHPPLGKALISLGIRTFGMNPFGWRITGTVAGILMVAVMYLLAFLIFRRRWIAVVATLLFTFDFMHFAQTRIGTVDSFLTFFLMLSYLCMFRWYELYGRQRRSGILNNPTAAFVLSGAFFGCACAVKWSGLYAGVGLALVFLLALWSRQWKGSACAIGWGTLSFLVLPFAIYCLSYIPYAGTPSWHGFGTIFENMQSMYTYHSRSVVEAAHPYSSFWYEWPIMYRPTWYFSNGLENGLHQGISTFGNPAVWWTGILAVAVLTAAAVSRALRRTGNFVQKRNTYATWYTLLFTAFALAAFLVGGNEEKYVRMFPYVTVYCLIMIAAVWNIIGNDRLSGAVDTGAAVLILGGYFSCLLPWVMVSRYTFIYHYFPCVPFVVLSVAACIDLAYRSVDIPHRRKVVLAACALAGVAIVLFAMFYPVLSGIPLDRGYVITWLKWFPSWALI